jgi:hypothetical protein
MNADRLSKKKQSKGRGYFAPWTETLNHAGNFAYEMPLERAPGVTPDTRVALPRTNQSGYSVSPITEIWRRSG